MAVTELYPYPSHDESIHVYPFTAASSLANLSSGFGNVMVHENMAFAFLGVILSTATDWNANSLLLGNVPKGARPSKTWTGTRRLMLIRGNNGTEVSLRNVEIRANGDVIMNSSIDVQDTLIAVLPGVPYYLS